MLRRVLLAIAAALIAVAVVLAVSGGFRATVGGLRFSARSPWAASMAAAIAGALWMWMARRENAIAADLQAAWHAFERHSTRIIGAIALVTAVVASIFATRSAAGADASGYVSEAQMWAAAGASYADPLVSVIDNPDGWLTSPLGWRPASTAGTQVPTYAPGLPLLMAIPHAVAGIDGATAVVIASAALAVWSTAMLAGGAAGVVAALLLAFTPVFLYQSFQPMSDVPVTAAWMFCFLLSRHGWSASAGAACAVAVLIRPNLAPLAIVPFLIVNRKIVFAAPVAIAAIALGAIQFAWYGSPFRSGYGTAEELFAFANVVPNAGRYLNWLVATAPVLLLAPFGFARLRNDPYARAVAALAVLVVCAYLVYAVFEHWSYLRFLLPAMAVFAIFAGIELARWIERWPIAARAPIFLVLALGITAHGLFVARSFDAFRLGDQLRRVERVAEAINHIAPSNAVIIAGEQSGAIRYYTSRSILRWDTAGADALGTAIEALLKAGHPIYIALDAWEMEPFRTRFPNLGPAELDWPPFLEAGSSHRTLAWNLADRFRYQIGQRINTVRIP